MSILCHECGHDIDAHHRDEDAQIDACWEPTVALLTYEDKEFECPCRLKPSQIAASLGTAEDWVERIDRDGLMSALVTGERLWGESRRPVDAIHEFLADAVLAKLPELMEEEK